MREQAKFALVLALLLPVVLGATVLVLVHFSGPSDNGLRCHRTPAESVCIVGRTTFFGLFGNSEFAVPESSIRAAKSSCATGHVGGRGSASCNVYLTPKSVEAGDVLVLSFTLADQADAATRRLNDYFGNPSATAIAIDEDLRTPLLLFALAPLLLLALGVAVRIRVSRSRRATG